MTPDEKRIVEWLRKGSEIDRAAMLRAGNRHDYVTARGYEKAIARDTFIANAIEVGQHRKDKP